MRIRARALAAFALILTGIQAPAEVSAETPAYGRAQVISLPASEGCLIAGRPRFAAALLRTRSPSGRLSLEIWGDVATYRPGDEVTYFLRAPEPVFVTLFWIGPEGDVFVPFADLALPGGRDVGVATGSVIVPPLGRERWVAIATRRPLPFTCPRGDRALRRLVARIRARRAAVGRWEVRSSRGHHSGAAHRR